MRKLLTILLMLIASIVKAQTEGSVIREMVPGADTMYYYVPVGWKTAPTAQKLLWFGQPGTGGSSWAAVMGEYPMKLFYTDGWNGKFVDGSGDTVYCAVAITKNTVFNCINYVKFTNYIFANWQMDTTAIKNQNRFVQYGYSAGPAEMSKPITNFCFDGADVSYARFRGRKFVTAATGYWQNVNTLDTFNTKCFYWGFVSNNDPTVGSDATNQLFTKFSANPKSSGYSVKKSILADGFGHLAADDTTFSIAGATAENNVWRWAHDTLDGITPPTPSPVPYKLNVTEKPFNATGGSKVRNPERLIDGNTATSYYTGNGQFDGLYFPTKNIFILDSNYTNLRVKAFTTTGGPGIYLKLFSENFSDSAVVEAAQGTTPYLDWKWIDTATSKAVTFPVRVVELTVKNLEYTINELEFWGNAESAATVNYFPKTTFTYNTQFKDFFASNINGDEPDTLFVTKKVNVNSHGFYNDTAITGITRGNHKFIFNIFGDDMTANFKQMKDSGITVYTYINGTSAANRPTPLAPYTTQPEGIYNYYNNEGIKYKNIPWGSDSTDPANWVDHARLAAAFAIYWGNNTSANSDGYNVTFTGSTPAKGRGTLAGIEIDNEDEAWWMDRTRYNSPQVKIAKLSPVYDSVKAKDPIFEVIDGAMSTPDSQYVKGKALYSYRYRGLNNYPADGLAFNYYITDIGGQGPNGNGISPEQGKLLDVMSGFVSVVHRYVGHKKFIYRELGWDATTGNSNYSVPVIAGSTLRKTVANWYLRATHISRLAGVDELYQYRSRDETNDQSNSADFVLSGQHTGWYANPDSSLKRWPLSYGMATTLDVYQHHKGRPTVIANGDSTSVWILMDTAVSGYDTVTYTVWKGTTNNSTQSFTINAPSGKSFAWIQKVEPKYDNGVSELGTGDLKGTRTSISPSSTISGTATETPVSYRVVLSNITVVDNIIRKSKSLRRLRSIN